MNIIFGDNIAYAVVEKIPLQEMATLDQFKTLHENLMVEYRKRNWKYCEDAMEHLKGRWNTELDTFYSEIYNRIQDLKTQLLPDDWIGAVIKSV